MHQRGGPGHTMDRLGGPPTARLGQFIFFIKRRDMKEEDE